MNSSLIQSFVARAVPYPHNRKFHAHESAVLFVFIREQTREGGINSFRRVLARERWQLLQLESHTKVTEEEMRAEEGVLWDGYQHACKHGDWIHAMPDHFGAGKSKPYGRVRCPRLTETHIDHIIERAGGTRYQPEGPENRRNRNADYILCDHIVELKEIRENALDKPQRQSRVGALFEDCLPDELTLPLDPSLLPPQKSREFFEILSEPVLRQVRSAVGQIRATRQALGNSEIRGALILINSGTQMLSHKLFHELAESAARRYREDFHELIVISTWFLTNGHNYNFNFEISPKMPTTVFQKAFRAAYEEGISALMTEWAQAGFRPPEDSLPVCNSLGFDFNGRSYYWEPRRLPNTMGLPEPII